MAERLNESQGLPDASENLHLADGVFHVEGATRGALYDTRSGNIYSINGEAVGVLTRKISNVDFLSKLQNMDLVVAKQPVVELTQELDRSLELQNPQLEFAWLEIEDKCNERCKHCYGAFGFKPASMADRLSHLDWKETITDVHSAGARTIQFIGGEPLMYQGNNKHEDVFDLIEHAKGVGFEGSDIEIFTNGTQLTEKRVSLIKKHGVNVAVSLYSSDSDVHDSITRVPGSHRLTMRGLRRLIDKQIPTRIGFVAMRDNQNTVLDTMKLLDEMGLGTVNPDVVRPTGSGGDADLQPDREFLETYSLQMKPDFKINREEFE